MIINGNALNIPLADCSVQTCVTSPPYFGLRDYGVAGQIGLEQTPDAYVAQLVAVFREVWRVLRDDGTLWLNIGDSYSADRKGSGGMNSKQPTNTGSFAEWSGKCDVAPKNLIGIPWRVAFALQAEGWYLRSDIIWHKPNPMPESVTDRPTKSHEYIFLLSKSPKYYYDADAIRDPASPALIKQVMDGYNGSATKDYAGVGVQNPSAVKTRIIEGARKRLDKQRGHSRRHAGFNDRWDGMSKAEQAAMGRNKRSVWTVATKPYGGAHFATFPPELITPCILAGAPEGGIVLDPFSGSGTTVATARQLGRVGIGIELNTEYIGLSQERNAQMTVWEAQS